MQVQIHIQKVQVYIYTVTGTESDSDKRSDLKAGVYILQNNPPPPWGRNDYMIYGGKIKHK